MRRIPDLKEAVDFHHQPRHDWPPVAVENLERLYNELLNKDWFMTFPDFKAYCQAREQALQRLRKPHGLGQENVNQHQQGRLLLL